MPRAKFWCGDECFRYCIVRRGLREAGYIVRVPEPRSTAGRLSLRKRVYDHWRVAEYLAGLGCPEIARVNRELGVKPKAKGDIDVLALRDGAAMVLEAKSRIIPRTLKRGSRELAWKLLEYHIAEPGRALAAWKGLRGMGMLESMLDNPASISELLRAAVAVLLEGGSPERLAIGVAAPFYIGPFVERAMLALGEVAGYLSRCLGLPVHPVLVSYVPDRLGLPTRFTARCIGSCEDVGLPPSLDFAVDRGLIGLVRGCRECSYHRVCAPLFRR